MGGDRSKFGAILHSIKVYVTFLLEKDFSVDWVDTLNSSLRDIIEAGLTLE